MLGELLVEFEVAPEFLCVPVGPIERASQRDKEFFAEKV